MIVKSVYLAKVDFFKILLRFESVALRPWGGWSNIKQRMIWLVAKRDC